MPEPKKKTVTLVSRPGGVVDSLYDETYQPAGQVLSLKRASHVEPKGRLPWWRWWARRRLRNIPLGSWYADLAPSGGPILGPFESRSDALIAEAAWLQENFLPRRK